MNLSKQNLVDSMLINLDDGLDSSLRLQMPQALIISSLQSMAGHEDMMYELSNAVQNSAKLVS